MLWAENEFLPNLLVLRVGWDSAKNRSALEQSEKLFHVEQFSKSDCSPCDAVNSTAYHYRPTVSISVELRHRNAVGPSGFSRKNDLSGESGGHLTTRRDPLYSPDRDSLLVPCGSSCRDPDERS